MRERRGVLFAQQQSLKGPLFLGVFDAQFYKKAGFEGEQLQKVLQIAGRHRFVPRRDKGH